MSCSCWFFLVSYNKSDSELFPVTSVLPRQHQLEPLVSSPLGGGSGWGRPSTVGQSGAGFGL